METANNQQRDQRNECANVLDAYNRWRRGDESVPMIDPRAIGDALDTAIKILRGEK